MIYCDIHVLPGEDFIDAAIRQSTDEERRAMCSALKKMVDRIKNWDGIIDEGTAKRLNSELRKIQSKDEYRRLFIMRKDLQMSPGKLAAQVGHCAEAYWLRLIQKAKSELHGAYHFDLVIPFQICDKYINGTITKIILEARNKNHLLKAVNIAEENRLKKDVDFGLIYDKCYTELKPEEKDGTVLTGIWFRPLHYYLAKEISKKYQLYK